MANKKKLTKKQKENYLKKSAHCPFCGIWDISGGSIDIIEGFATQEVHCLECDRRWTDIYTLTGVEEADL